jgi:hypothetical protein
VAADGRYFYEVAAEVLAETVLDHLPVWLAAQRCGVSRASLFRWADTWPFQVAFHQTCKRLAAARILALWNSYGHLAETGRGCRTT